MESVDNCCRNLCDEQQQPALVPAINFIATPKLNALGDESVHSVKFILHGTTLDERSQCLSLRLQPTVSPGEPFIVCRPHVRLSRLRPLDMHSVCMHAVCVYTCSLW